MDWKAPAWLVPFGAGCAALAVIAALFGNSALLWPSLWLFVATLVAANIARIERLKASSSGIEFEAKKAVEEARSTVAEMQLLAKHLAMISLALVKRSARIGGFPPREEENIRERTIALLRNAHVDEKEFAEVLEEWHRWVANDYIFGILGNSVLPDELDDDARAQWKDMRCRAFADDRPSVTELSDWLERHNFLDDEHRELLADLAYYLEHKCHRRFDVWEHHHEWPRLTARR